MVALLCKKYKVEFFQLKNIPHNQKECKFFVKKGNAFLRKPDD